MGSKVSLHLMVKNGGESVLRMIKPLVGFVDELVFADTGSTDGTPEKIADLCGRKDLKFIGHNCSPELDPKNFFVDSPDSFIPRSFTTDEKMMGYSGEKMMIDWSVPRNLISNSCSCDYVMKMDAEDVATYPENIKQVVEFFDRSPAIEFVGCPYFVKKSANPDDVDVEVYTRFWRNKPHIRFREKCHENVDYLRYPDGTNWIITNDAFSVVDYRDGLIAGRSVKHRNFKVLLFEYDRCSRLSIRPSKHTLLYLAQEALGVAPAFSICVLSELNPRRFTKTDGAWYHFLLGMAMEILGRMEDALEEYATASSFVLFPRARLRLAILQAKMKFPGCRTELATSLMDSQKIMYPFGASFLEKKEATSLLEK